MKRFLKLLWQIPLIVFIGYASFFVMDSHEKSVQDFSFRYGASIERRKTEAERRHLRRILNIFDGPAPSRSAKAGGKDKQRSKVSQVDKDTTLSTQRNRLSGSSRSTSHRQSIRRDEGR